MRRGVEMRPRRGGFIDSLALVVVGWVDGGRNVESSGAGGSHLVGSCRASDGGRRPHLAAADPQSIKYSRVDDKGRVLSAPPSSDSVVLWRLDALATTGERRLRARPAGQPPPRVLDSGDGAGD